MSIYDNLPAGLSGLADLARQDGLDMRPVLLRVLTDLFVSKKGHTPDERRSYSEIATHLVRDVDDATRADVARKVASEPDVPRVVVAWLIAKGGPAAATILADSPLVDEPIMIDVARNGPPTHALAIAARDDVTDEVVEILAKRSDPDIDLVLAANPDASIGPDTFARLTERARQNRELAAALCRRAGSGHDILALFGSADPSQRTSLLALAVEAESATSDRGPFADSWQLQAIERAALSGDREHFEAAAADALNCSPTEFSHLLEDPTGESLALALAALGMPEEAATRVFLRSHPDIACSVDRVFALTVLVRTIPPPAAQRVVFAMLGQKPPRITAPPARYDGAFDQTASSTPSRASTNARRALTHHRSTLRERSRQRP